MELDDLVNPTANQHFISQAEQRLNSCSSNPNSKKSEIYRFEIAERNPPKVISGEKVSIGRNLSFQEIFTIHRLSGNERLNFENLFKRYEDEFLPRAQSLAEFISIAREKSADASGAVDLKNIDGLDFNKIVDDLKFVFKYKIMNGLRNPYSIKNTLREFESFLDHAIFEEEALKIYIALELKNKSEKDYICSQFSISESEYKKWIRLLLMFLYIQKNGFTMLDGFVDEFFKAKDLYTHISIGLFDNYHALLTDTGVVKDNSAYNNTTYINVSKNIIVGISQQGIGGALLSKFCQIMKITESDGRKILIAQGGQIYGKLYINDLGLLSGYNKICVKAAAKYVFSASSEISGVEILNRR